MATINVTLQDVDLPPGLAPIISVIVPVGELPPGQNPTLPVTTATLPGV